MSQESSNSTPALSARDSTEKPRLYDVKLTIDELSVLDFHYREPTAFAGSVLLQNNGLSEEVKAVIKVAKMERRLCKEYNIPANIASMVGKIIRTAISEGKLSYVPVRVSTCPCCCRNEGYHPHERDKYTKSFGSRFLTTRKGDPNYNKPRLFTCYDLGRGCVTISHIVFTGYCEKCAPIVETVLMSELAELDYEHPPGWPILTNRFKRYGRSRCKQCKWEGGENEMLQLIPLSGSGTYPGGCPRCGAESRFLGPTVFESAPGFVLVPITKKEGV